MRHQRFASLTLMSACVWGSCLFADTPVKPAQSSFGPLRVPSQSPPAQQLTVSQAEKLVAMSEEKPVQQELKVTVDYAVKAATIEVAWLQDPVTYPYCLRAESVPGENAIKLTGYLPSEKLREKALFAARLTVGNLTLVDQMTVHPQMAVAQEVPAEANQSQLVLERIEKVVPGISKMLQVTVDASGVTTVFGRVDEFSDRLKIIHALQGIPGCTAIRYDLRVYMPAQQVVAATPPVVVPAVTPASNVVPVVVAPPLKPAVTEAKTPVNPQPPTLPAPPKPKMQEAKPKEPVKAATAPAAKIQPVSDITSSATQILQAGCIELTHPLMERPAMDKVVVAESISGLFPPGMSGRSTEPGIILGSPIIVKASYDINLDINLAQATDRLHKTKAIEITSTSTQVSPVTAAEPAPVPIGIMPRLAK